MTTFGVPNPPVAFDVAFFFCLSLDVFFRFVVLANKAEPSNRVFVVVVVVVENTLGDAKPLQVDGPHVTATTVHTDNSVGTARLFLFILLLLDGMMVIVVAVVVVGNTARVDGNDDPMAILKFFWMWLRDVCDVGCRHSSIGRWADQFEEAPHEAHAGFL